VCCRGGRAAFGGAALFTGLAAAVARVGAFVALLRGVAFAAFLAGFAAFFVALRRPAGAGLAFGRDALRVGFAALGAFRVFRDFDAFARAPPRFWLPRAALLGRFVARAALEVRRRACFLAMPV
jgi:hypothetical protein